MELIDELKKVKLRNIQDPSEVHNRSSLKNWLKSII
ncbi:hypothetical protein ACEQPO_12815 [Bacillus sp. SL00103]